MKETECLHNKQGVLIWSSERCSDASPPQYQPLHQGRSILAIHLSIQFAFA